jgi:hypothetical protein
MVLEKNFRRLETKLEAYTEAEKGSEVCHDHQRGGAGEQGRYHIPKP